MSPEDSGTPRAIIYTRVAREQDSPETSEAQRAAVEAAGAARGLGVIEPYGDDRDLREFALDIAGLIRAGALRTAREMLDEACQYLDSQSR